ncbi:methylated-DNA--[protein]-cysteine S-methyltransferase [Hoeflea prorocentri]|uniref:Methylated-DNA--[protein]-cysteine S-methyltransferase n=1 Tax=Hoeflea prorocentri TaxID=1922333 RepID=A0A9X3ZJ43_9HYPH|nr:methylated-DNA--[protein]-cysteine S-methyltransferase [Hoeflea prorocentri]MCY6383084.1 methylated-DNA--[protein]-cysteine S-methyltransferase [Hoeflea prorocentri]MDA5400884.1 methylated-DNA--[protein]-cysteine S-methyltransferase [Hoeflea prorocentri]
MTKPLAPLDIEDTSSAEKSRHVAHVDTPLGTVVVIEEGGKIIRLFWDRDTGAYPQTERTDLLDEAERQLNAYFDGTLKRFDLPLALSSSPFERQVQEKMIAIPYGETRTYGDIARDLETYGQPVGQACGANSIPIIIPCHRVLSATGIGGFSGEGGIETKIQLLKHEGGFPFLL